MTIDYTLPLKEQAVALAAQKSIDQVEFLNVVGFTQDEGELREVLEPIGPPRGRLVRDLVRDAIIDRIELYDPRAVIEEWYVSPKAAPRYFLSIADLRAMPSPEFLYEDMVQERGLHLLIGAYGSFKTFMALNIAIGVAAAGRKVIYFLNEGQDVVKARWSARTRWLGIPDPPVGFVIDTRHLINDAADMVARINGEYGGADLLIFDTLRRATVGMDEDKSGDFARIVAACDYIRRQTGAAIVLVDHTGHDRSRARGTSAKYDSVDVALLMERDEGTAASSVTLRCQKMKGAPEWRPRRYHLLDAAGPVLVPAGEHALSPDEGWKTTLREVFGTREFTTADAAKALEMGPTKARDLLNAMHDAHLVGGSIIKWRLGQKEGK
jgi:hypothetical protein